MRILFIGDSLGLPRPHKINKYSPSEKELAVAYEDTYSSIINFELLKKYKLDPYIEVINRAKRFYTIKDIKNEFADHLFFFEPDVIVIQVGIVDCWFRDHLNGKQMVGIEEFEKYLMNILNLLKQRPNCRLVIIGIAPTSTKMDNRYKGINKEISSYNEIIKSNINHSTIFYVDLEKHIRPTTINEYLLPDDNHLNKKGNRLLSKLLINLLKAIIESDKGVHYYEKDKYHQSLIHFQKSYDIYPFYIDNLYNALILNYKLEKQDQVGEIVTFIKNNNLMHGEIEELVSVLTDERVV